MRRFLNRKSRQLFCGTAAVFVLIGIAAALLDYEPVIAFLAVMMLSLAVLGPMGVVFLMQHIQVNRLIQKQEEETNDVFSQLDDSQMKQLNSYLAINEDWVVNGSLGSCFVLHCSSIVSIQEYEQGIALFTTLREKPFRLKLSEGESGQFEKKSILHWYDPLYEIPLEEVSFVSKKQSSKKWIIVSCGIICAILGVMFTLSGNLIPEYESQDEFIYFYDYLKDTSNGDVSDISYEIVKVKDEILMYIFNHGETYAEVELNLYNDQDEKMDTVYSGIIRPNYYVSEYIDQVPEKVSVNSAWFYTFEYQVPSIEYAAEYARREYNVWINVVLSSDQLTLDHIKEIGVHEYAIEDLAYTGADCVYIYDETAKKTIDQVTNTEIWDTATARYRIDFETYDYRIQLIELNEGEEILIETVQITEEIQNSDDERD